MNWADAVEPNLTSESEATTITSPMPDSITQQEYQYVRVNCTTRLQINLQYKNIEMYGIHIFADPSSDTPPKSKW